jgi:hypothetical protein
MPRFAIVLVLTATLALMIGAFYSLKLDPELAYWAKASELKLDWVEEMRREHGHVIGVVGGSTTTFGIDAEYMHKEYNLPVANLGLHAGMGPDACVGLGFAALRRGDTLILSLEPGMLTKDDGVSSTHLGTKLALRLQKPELISWRRGISYSVPSIPTELQPGGYHLVTMLAKLAFSKPLYRYSIKDMRPGGLQTTSERRPMATSHSLEGEDSKYLLSYGGRTFLKAAQREADQRGINLVYVLPWTYAPSDLSAKHRQGNMRLLNEVQQFVPVLDEPELGVHVVEEDFSDSGQHLTADAARRRSSALVDMIGSYLRYGADNN